MTYSPTLETEIVGFVSFSCWYDKKLHCVNDQSFEYIKIVVKDAILIGEGIRPRSHDAGMTWKRHHWPGTVMILLRIDKCLYDAG